MNKILNSNQKGQALITLLFFVAIATIVTSAAVIILYDNSLSTARLSEGTKSYYLSESGIENALLRIIRDPTYAGEIISLPEGDITIQVTNNSGIYTINSESTVGDSIRQTEVTADYSSAILTITSWKEMY